MNTNISAYAQVHGAYDFNSNPVAPRGTCMVVHENHKFVEDGKLGELMAGIWVTVFTTIDVLNFFQITHTTAA